MDQNLRILLVDDDPDDQEIFIWIMKNTYPSFEIDTAADGLEALAKLENKQYHPDLIFLDLNMPKMHGLDCLQYIRQIDRLTGVPVIVYSTSSNPHDISRSWAAGATEYIVKGNEIAAIKRELLQVLNKYNSPLSTNEHGT